MLNIKRNNSKLYNDIITSLPPMKIALYTRFTEMKKIKINEKTYFRKIMKIKKNSN